jgi:hypothetical protein
MYNALSSACLAEFMHSVRDFGIWALQARELRIRMWARNKLLIGKLICSFSSRLGSTPTTTTPLHAPHDVIPITYYATIPLLSQKDELRA